MPLTLVTGPANAAKAQFVIDRVRAELAGAPLLVVPTASDVDRYRRELAGDGALLGARVVRFDGLLEEIALRAGVVGRPLGPLARERIAAAAVARTELRVLRRAAETRGFTRAAVELFSELEAQRVDAPRLTAALRAWASEDAGRRAYADDVARLYRSYRDALERSGFVDAELHAVRALDAMRLAPGSWSATAVYVYGFDDLTPLQLDAVETLARVVDARVTVSLTHEPGRIAFSAGSSTFEDLRALAGEHVALPARDRHYASEARRPLHHLERYLFEVGAERLAPAPALKLLEGGGERAELELVAAEISALLSDGMAAEDITVAVRSPTTVASLLERVFSEFEIPFAHRRRVRFGATGPGRALLALLRCALPEGSADDLLAWLRAPGVLVHPALADALEARVRREGAATAAAARELWELERWPLDAVDRVSRAAARGGDALPRRLGAELGALLAAPWRRSAPRLDAQGTDDAQAAGQARRALDELAELAVGDRRLAPGATELEGILDDLDVIVGTRPGPGLVTVTDPLAIRARRVRALFVCGLQEGEFPQPPRFEPFFGEERRREIALASGLVMRRREDPLAWERRLFYAAVSRAEELLFLSWRSAGDDGSPTVRSFFVDDVRDLFGAELWTARRTRPLGAVSWPGDVPDAATQRERHAAATGPRVVPPGVAPLRDPGVLAEIAGRPSWSASSLEVWGECPVKWLIERHLRAAHLEPDAEPLARGSLAHEVLEATLRGLADETGSARVVPENLIDACERMRAALEQAAQRIALSPNPDRHRIAVRRLEADLERYLTEMAACVTAFEPRHLELDFGFDESEYPPLELAQGLGLRGRIDRVDVDEASRRALVYDYKGARAVEGAKWASEGRLQMPLYMLAVSRLLGLEPVGGLYQPLGAGDLRPRGVLAEDADERIACVATDRRSPDALTAVLDDALGRAVLAADEARSGALEPRPRTCAWRGGCSYPTICRAESG